MNGTLSIHIGGGFDDDRRRILAAAQRAVAGEVAAPESHLSFENWATFFRVMTPTRLVLLRAVHADPPPSTRALAERLGRDTRRVQADVAALLAAGLLERHGTRISTEWDGERADIEAA